MNKLKAFAVIGMVLAGAATFAAVKPATVEDVNKSVADLLAPYNNKLTTARVTFTDLLIDATKARRFGVQALYSKLGASNALEFKLEKLNYVNETVPTVDLALSFKLDFVKAFSQNWVNENAPSITDLIQGISSEFTATYGPALTLDAKIDELLKDEQDNVISVKFHIDAVVDVSKLPEGTTEREVEFKRLRVDANLSRMDGSLTVAIELNPKNKRFDSDQQGFKELIESLQNKDKETYDDLKGMVDYVDRMAEWLTNKEPDKD